MHIVKLSIYLLIIITWIDGNAINSSTPDSLHAIKFQKSFSFLGHKECNFPDVKQRILDKHCLNFLSVNSGLPYCIGYAEKINYQHQSPSKI